jgi:hypothetical protein
MHAEQLRQLTGCRYAVIVNLERRIGGNFTRNGSGAPFRRPVRTIIVAALIKLRGNDAYRTLSIYLGIPHVTLHRYATRVVALLAGQRLGSGRRAAHGWLIVDTTCNRVRSIDKADYSGYKHHHIRKVQVVADDRSRIVDTSPAWSGATHDKEIWNGEFGRVRASLDRPVLGDKAYAGGDGEGELLFRPVEKNERAYKADVDGCKAANRRLSKVRVTVEHVFAKLKTFRIIQGQFAFLADRYGDAFRAVAVLHNMNLDERNAHTPA